MREKTLYVSDLDGTLLNRQKKISDYTAKVLNSCIKKGMKFAVATARMPYGCDYRLSSIAMDTPGILTNGVFLYDFKQEKVISAEKITSSGVNQVLEAFRREGLSCFVYTYDEQGISIYYEDRELESQTQYYSDRALEKCVAVSLVENIQEVVFGKQVAYLTYTGEKERLEPVSKRLDSIEEVSYSFYLNIYNGLYCLEVFSKNASKKHALQKLKTMMECEEVVVFGDNFNDLSMIEIADRSYAPANALEEVKERVTDILLDCDQDGVAHFLEDEWNTSNGQRL